MLIMGTREQQPSYRLSRLTLIELLLVAIIAIPAQAAITEFLSIFHLGQLDLEHSALSR